MHPFICDVLVEELHIEKRLQGILALEEGSQNAFVVIIFFLFMTETGFQSEALMGSTL